MENAIEIINVSKKFRRGEKFSSLRDAVPQFFQSLFSKQAVEQELQAREFWALKDMNLTIKKGEVLGLIGPNGAGKSTFLKLLSGILEPTTGTMSLRGRLSALIEVSAGFHGELTGRENVYLNGTILGMKKKEIDAKFDQILKFSGVGEFIDTPVKRYSSGMYSRLGFAIAAHVDPDILLVDEVLSVGDIAFQTKCAQKMRELLQSGVTIILVSHNLSLIQSLCKRVVLIDKGTCLQEGPPDQVIPYYENLVYQQKEEELRRDIEQTSGRLRLVNEDQDIVTIAGVQLAGNDGQPKDNFAVHESVKITVNFNALHRVDRPIFSIDIIRNDGILCCSSWTSDQGFEISSISGKGQARVDLGRLDLAPGIYLIRVAIWDKDLIHPFVIRKKEVFRINADGAKRHENAVFLSEFKWEVQ